MKKLIVMCSVVLALSAGRIAWAEQENPDPPPDEDVNCPEGTTPMEGGDSCETAPGEQCPEGWTWSSPGDPGTQAPRHPGTRGRD